MQDSLNQNHIRTADIGHEALAGLQRLFAEAAEKCSESLSAKLGYPVSINLEHCSQRSFRQYVYSLAPPINMMRLRNQQDHQSWWVCPDTIAISTMLDLMFGASSVTWNPMDRSVTSVEAELLQSTLDEILRALCETWRPVCPVDLSLWQWFHQLAEIESDLRESLDQSMVSFTWEMSVHDRTALINIALPTTFVLAWEKRLTQYHYDELEPVAENQIRATVRLLLPDVEPEQLQVGQTIATGHSIDEPLELAAGQGESIAVHLGAVDGLKAFEVTGD